MKKVWLSIWVLMSFQSLASAQGQVIFEDDFETSVLGPAWAAYPNLTGANGIIEVAQGAPAQSGAYGLRIGKSSDAGGQTINALDLHIDLSGYSQVNLSFWIRDIADETNPADQILFSDDGGQTFPAAYDLNPGNWCNSWGQLPPIDLDELVSGILELNENFVIRWQQEGSSDFAAGFGLGSSDGFFLDNVLISEPEIVYYDPCPNRLEDDFEDGYLRDWWRWVQASATEFPNEGTVKPEGFAGILEGSAAHSGTYGVGLGNRCDGSTTTNALDLHLNLSNCSRYYLSFWLRDRADETNPQDAIYFSNDGGHNFSKVLSLNLSEWCDEYGQLPPISIDQLAEEAGLQLSDQFIIRFQQSGIDDFTSGFGFGNADGLFIDDISVYAQDEPLYHTLPFEDGFEEGILGDEWRRANAENTEFPAEGTVRPAGLVEVVGNEFPSNSGSYSLAMGKRACDESSFTTNAADLYLNLADASNVVLSFWIRNRGDETNPQDALYFSDDGGASFHKGYNIDGNNLPGNQYQEILIGLDSIFAVLNLQYSEKCVVRFQQHGREDLYAGFGFGTSDGFLIDDVRVEGNINSANEMEGGLMVMVFPNPCTGWLFLDMISPGLLAEDWEWKIAGIDGRILELDGLNSQVFPVKIDVVALPSGIYMLEGRSGPYRTIRRFVKL